MARVTYEISYLDFGTEVREAEESGWYLQRVTIVGNLVADRKAIARFHNHENLNLTEVMLLADATQSGGFQLIVKT